MPEVRRESSVSSANPLFTYWYFHLPNLVLATLMYTALGRFVLSFIFDPESKNYIWRFFILVSDPVIKLVGYVTPRAVPATFLLLFTVVWLFAARAGLLAVVASFGMAPTTGVTP
jgi:YggT family protein